MWSWASCAAMLIRAAAVTLAGTPVLSSAHPFCFGQTLALSILPLSEHADSVKADMQEAPYKAFWCLDNEYASTLTSTGSQRLCCHVRLCAKVLLDTCRCHRRRLGATWRRCWRPGRLLTSCSRCLTQRIASCLGDIRGQSTLCLARLTRLQHVYVGSMDTVPCISASDSAQRRCGRWRARSCRRTASC